MNDQIVFPVATCTHRESHLRCTLGAGKATGTCSIRNAIDDKPTRPLRYIASLQFSSVTYPKSSPFIGLKRRYRVQSISLGHGGKSSFTKDSVTIRVMQQQRLVSRYAASKMHTWLEPFWHPGLLFEADLLFALICLSFHLLSLLTLKLNINNIYSYVFRLIVYICIIFVDLNFL